jgi:hypothetical protein
VLGLFRRRDPCVEALELLRASGASDHTLTIIRRVLEQEQTICANGHRIPDSR